MADTLMPAPPPPSTLPPIARALVRTLASGLGAGYSPFAPGTVGTLTGAAAYLILFSRLGLGAYVLVTLAFIPLSILIAHWAEPLFGKRDAGHITIDEWAGLFVTMTGAKFLTDADAGWNPHLLLGAGFLLFRFFDILKPWPCRRIDQMKNGGFSVVMDDVMAGVYAALLMCVLALVWAAL